ncbi:MAG: 2-succinylbenzoate--CoA ligase [Chlamydiae bacterium]|nr:2-succinylbenzoate--CoA ligase [Chlamydiota bacterium]
MMVFECPFSLHARKSGNSIALATLGKSWTYLQCHELIEGIAKTLRAERVKPGDRVALFPTKDFPTPLLFFALFRVGAICCPLNIYLPKESIPQTLDALGATVFLIPDEESYPTVKQITLSFSKLIKTKKASQTFLDKEAHATYLFTSGTTAQPKIACHSLGNHYYSALGSNARMAVKPGDHYLLSLPLYHIAGIAILFRTFLEGATVLLSREIGHTRATHLSLVPTQLYRLLKNPVHGHLKHILLGGSNISHNLYKEALQNGLPVHPTYGMTEMSSQIATHFEAHSFSLGHPLPFREMKIADDGEIYVRGKTLFQGYFDLAKGLKRPLNDEGWFCTGDLGVYSPETGLQILGRKDRLFISGGENIHPEEIEKILGNFEGIESAEVVPIPDDEFGFRPVAYIKSEKGYNEEKLKTFLASILPKFKVPVAFYFSRNP